MSVDPYQWVYDGIKKRLCPYLPSMLIGGGWRSGLGKYRALTLPLPQFFMFYPKTDCESLFVSLSTQPGLLVFFLLFFGSTLTSISSCVHISIETDFILEI